MLHLIRFFLIMFVCWAPVFCLKADVKRRPVCRPGQMQAQQGDPFLLYADVVEYDRLLGIWRFMGHVEAKGDQEEIRADQLIYNEKTELLIATGNVRFKGPDDQLFFAEYIEVTGQFKEVLLRQVRFLMEDKSRFVASKVLQDNQTKKTTLQNSAYTPCFPCKENPRQPPLWQIKARKVIKDGIEEKIIYIDPHIEFSGTPVLYMPYLSFPTKRASGFLTPKYGTSSILGTFAGVPYFIAAEHFDVMLTPFVTTKRGFVSGADYRHRGHFFDLDLKSSLNISEQISYTQDNVKKTTQPLRGHVFFKWRYDINDQWRIKANSDLSSDATYLRSLESLPIIGDKWSRPFLESDLNIERFSTYDYLQMSGYGYQDLSEEKKKLDPPYVVPFVTYNYTTPPLWQNSYAQFKTHFATINRSLGDRYTRLIVDGGWHLPYVTDWGQMGELFATLRGDVYYTSLAPEGQTADRDYTTRWRSLPRVGIRNSWPFKLQEVPFMLAPFANVILAPPLSKQEHFPVGDSKAFEYNDSTFLRTNRSSGYDQIDTGSRVVYGSKFLLKGFALGDIHFLLGQTYTFTEPSVVIKYTGAEKGFSDVVGSLRADPYEWLSLDYRFRLDRERLSTRFSEFSGFFGPDYIRLGLAYTKLDEDFLPFHRKQAQEMISSSLVYKPHKHWGIQVGQGYNLTEKKLLNIGADIVYQNECFKCVVRFSRSFYKARDIRPNNTFAFAIGLKNLGSNFSGRDLSLKASHNAIVQQHKILVPGEAAP